MTDVKKFILTSSEIAEREQPFSHPWNPKSQLIGVQLGRALGLKRTGINIARIPSGKESFVYHSHQHEEEWLYILSGRGIAEIDDQEIEVGPGDFIGFPTPSIPHHLKNPFDQDLVYLMGGENREMEIADFPAWTSEWSGIEKVSWCTTPRTQAVLPAGYLTGLHERTSGARDKFCKRFALCRS